MKSIVRKDTGEDWKEYVTRLMRAEGVVGPSKSPLVPALSRSPNPLKQPLHVTAAA
jgi:hypothetical protein